MKEKMNLDAYVNNFIEMMKLAGNTVSPVYMDYEEEGQEFDVVRCSKEKENGDVEIITMKIGGYIQKKELNNV